MDIPVVKISNLSHKYSNAWAIQDINIEISQTGILGLLGSNGAGKSTTMNILCGVLTPTSGTVLINGIDLSSSPSLAKREIGFLPQTAPLHLDLTVDEYLEHCAYMKLMERKKIPIAVKEVKERCGITHFSNRLIGNLSGGYRQRVGIAQAIIHRPKLVVLDEPTNGLDPIQILEVRNIIREIALDRTVIFSTHILSEVQVLCKNIVMIEKGHVVFSDTMNAFDNYFPSNSLMVTMKNPPAADVLTRIEGVVSVEFITEQLVRIRFEGGQLLNEKIINLCVHNNWGLQEINIERCSLNETFAHLSQKS